MWNCKSFYQAVCFIQLSEAGVLSISLKMDKIECRAVIKFFVKEGLTPNEIHSKFIKVYADSSPSFSTIKKWAAEFKRGRTGLEDDPRKWRPRKCNNTRNHWTSARYGIGWPADESAWNCWDYRHFKRRCASLDHNRSSFRVTLWPMWLANSKRQPCFYPPQSHAQEGTQNWQKKLTNLMGNLCCAREHSVQFFLQFFYTVKLHSLT